MSTLTQGGNMTTGIIARERIESKILSIRGLRVLVDRDLARLYQVPTKRLNEQVKRNRKRFPSDFMFQMTKIEFNEWKSHFATSKKDKMSLRKRPFVFTQEGVAMLSSVLSSDRAILVNVTIMRAFVKLSTILATHKDLARKLKELEEKYNSQFRVVFEAIRKLMAEEKKPVRKIGFHS